MYGDVILETLYANKHANEAARDATAGAIKDGDQIPSNLFCYDTSQVCDLIDECQKAMADIEAMECERSNLKGNHKVETNIPTNIEIHLFQPRARLDP